MMTATFNDKIICVLCLLENVFLKFNKYSTWVFLITKYPKHNIIDLYRNLPEVCVYFILMLRHGTNISNHSDVRNGLCLRY